MNYVDHHKEEFTQAVAHLKHDIASLRTGRATPALVEDIPVECYGGHQPLKAVASISVSDPKTLAVEVWDKSLLSAVESAIRLAPIGVNPVNDGKLIRVPLPDLNAERRQELIKLLHQKLEQARIAVRQVRENVKKAIDAAEKDGSATEDEKFKQYEALEKLTKDTNEQIRRMGEEKEKEIQTI